MFLSMRDMCTYKCNSLSSFKAIATKGITVDINIDDSGRLITDTGKNCSVDEHWKTTQRFTLPSDTKSVTIKGRNPGGAGGILASFNNNVVTDDSWECADMKGCGSSCDDGSYQPAWKQAVTYGRNDDATTIWYEGMNGKLNNIESNAQWIWVTDSMATNVWCRKTFCKLGTNLNT